MEINELLKKWSEKMGVSVSIVEKDYNKVLSEAKQNLKGLDNDALSQRALKILSLSYKRQLRSPAIGFEGIVIGVSDAVDTVAKSKKEAVELYKTDPQLAISQGLVSEDGVPLDTRKEWASGKPNQNFGNPLPEKNLLRNVFGIAIKTKVENDTPKFFSMTISGDKAENDEYLLFKPVRFMAIDKTAPELLDKAYTLNSSFFTEFIVDEEINLPKIEDLLKSCISFVDIKNLEEYHKANKENFNRIVAVAGDVVSLNLQPTSIGSRVMTIEDGNSSLEDLDAKGVTCWISPRINIDFAEGSKVVVIGRTGQGKKKDEQGNLTEELGDVTLNVFGLYPLPEFKIALPSELKEITGDDLTI